MENKEKEIRYERFMETEETAGKVIKRNKTKEDIKQEKENTSKDNK